MLTSYRPASLPPCFGERLTAPVVDCLTSGVRAGMLVPDAADPELESVRVVEEE
jgi:arginine decarboxylase